MKTIIISEFRLTFMTSGSIITLTTPLSPIGIWLLTIEWKPLLIMITSTIITTTPLSLVIMGYCMVTWNESHWLLLVILVISMVTTGYFYGLHVLVIMVIMVLDYYHIKHQYNACYHCYPPFWIIGATIKHNWPTIIITILTNYYQPLLAMNHYYSLSLTIVIPYCESSLLLVIPWNSLIYP